MQVIVIAKENPQEKIIAFLIKLWQHANYSEL